MKECKRGWFIVYNIKLIYVLYFKLFLEGIFKINNYSFRLCFCF